MGERAQSPIPGNGSRARNGPPPRARWRAWLCLFRAALVEYERDYARYFAGAIVYYALISLVPLVLLLLASLGLLLRRSDFAAAFAQHVLQTVDSKFGAPLRETLEQWLQRVEQGSVIATFVALIGLLLTASVLFAHLRITFRAIWKQSPPLASGTVRAAIAQFVFEKAIAFLMVLAGGPVLFAGLVLIAMLHWVGGLLGNVPLLGAVTGRLLAFSTPLLFVPVMFALLFKFLPPVRVRWRHVWPAMVLCSVGWLAGAELLALYAVYFGTNLTAYGALGGMLILMLWIKTIAQMLFVGAELCKVASRSSPTAAGSQADFVRAAPE